jgi:hypothetical protein
MHVINFHTVIVWIRFLLEFLKNSHMRLPFGASETARVSDFSANIRMIRRMCVKFRQEATM